MREKVSGLAIRCASFSVLCRELGSVVKLNISFVVRIGTGLEHINLSPIARAMHCEIQLLLLRGVNQMQYITNYIQSV